METGLEAEILLRIILQEDKTRVVLRRTFVVGGMRLMVSSLVSMIERSGIDPWPRTLCCVMTLSVSLSIQVYKWVVANFMIAVTLRLTRISSRGEGGIAKLLVASCYRNRDKPRYDGSFCSYANIYLDLRCKILTVSK